MNKLLLIEDDPVTQMLCKRLIKKASIADEIITASNGRQALDYYEELFQTAQENIPLIYPKLVFLDLNMPVLDGWQFLEEFKDTYLPKLKETRVFIVTSSVNPEDKEKAKNHSIVEGFLSKPLTPDMFETLKETYTGS